MRIAICDDVFEHREKCGEALRTLSRKHNISLEIVMYESGEQLLFAMEDESSSINLVYLDIGMPGPDGIVVAQKIRELQYNCEIVFFTVKDNCWKAAFYVQALHYIIKDEYDNDEFEKIFLMAAREVQKNISESMLFTCAGESRNISISDIRYFEVYRHVVSVHYQDDQRFDFYTPLGKLEEMLFGKSFVRCHRSFLVAKKYIERMTGNKIVLKNGVSIPIGRTYREHVRQELRKK